MRREPGPASGGRLAVLVKRFPRLSETFVLNEVLELRRQGVPLDLFALLDPREPLVHEAAQALQPEVSYLRAGEGWSGWFGAVREGGVACVHHPLGTSRAISFAARRRRVATLRHLVEALVLVRRMDARGVTHLHAHFAHSPAAVAELASLISGVPFSFTAHAKDLYTTPAEFIARRTNKASLVVTCTDANRGYIAAVSDIDPDDVVLAHHGVDVDRFAGALDRPRCEGRILTVGRLVPKKGHAVLIEALRILAALGVDFEWRVIGGGPLLGELRLQIEAAGIADRVTFVGALSQDEVIEEFAEAAIFALTPVVLDDGDRDGIPNVLREAMAAGVAVVTTEISGIPELVRDGSTGWLVPPHDPLATARVLAVALTDDCAREKIGGAGREWVALHCRLSDSVAPLVELFRASGVSQVVRTPT